MDMKTVWAEWALLQLAVWVLWVGVDQVAIGESMNMKDNSVAIFYLCLLCL